MAHFLRSQTVGLIKVVREDRGEEAGRKYLVVCSRGKSIRFDLRMPMLQNLQAKMYMPGRIMSDGERLTPYPSFCEH